MKNLYVIVGVVSLLFVARSLSAGEESALAPELEPLRPFLGKTWRAEFAKSTPEKPLIDVMRWERVLNGKAIRVMHSLNNGEYGGETIFNWEPQQKAVTYHYFTTAGFMTTGTASFQDGKMSTLEKVAGEAGGITEVRSTSELRSDGTFHVVTEYLRNGEWAPGRDSIYTETPGAEVVFR